MQHAQFNPPAAYIINLIDPTYRSLDEISSRGMCDLGKSWSALARHGLCACG
jgi:hypothetical protein